MSVLTHLLRWQFGLADAEVWTTPAERACLIRHAAGKRRLAEIGVWHAGTTKGLRAAMASNGTLFAIDPYERGRLGFSIPRIVGRRELASIPNGQVVWVRKTGVEAARSREVLEAVPLDFVFVDNAQTYETLQAEWEAWAPHVGPGGVLALHDTRPTPGEPAEQTSVRFAREVVFADPRFEVADTADSLTVLRRLDS
jgi:hypothetical protein